MDPDDRNSNGSSSKSRRSAEPKSPIPRHQRPDYMAMQVGTGSRSQYADHLTSLLDTDSGYGGSTMDPSFADGWNPGLTEDRPTPGGTPVLDDGSEESERQRAAIAGHTIQMYYNRNRTSLIRAIGDTEGVLTKFQEMNQAWPTQYPPEVQVESNNASSARPVSRPGLQHSFTTSNLDIEPASSSRPGPKRAETSLGPRAAAESSSAAAQKRETESEREPRLLDAQVAHQFSLLKLELKIAGREHSVHNFNKEGIASLLDNQIRESVRHLHSLRDRVEDTSSKVLVTGDLNAGKSTFCNALLRRKVLPEDQQPCTSIFCEVLDARENSQIEEVHAIRHGSVYNRDDETTYEVFSLKELENIVIDDETYSSCKIYVKDSRPFEQSLLNNGTVDIVLIDAPGLNMNSIQTTALFARQQEIDVIVFVVSASNHFTQSAKEFIINANNEKEYMFTVVNGFDQIRDKQRCEKMVLSQLAKLSPTTFKESKELVHFVSSNAIPMAPGSGPNNGAKVGAGGSGGSGGFGDPDDDDPYDGDRETEGKHGEPGSPVKGKGKGKEKEKQRDFDYLETSLRRFVLEKRARSKLAPAKKYLMNLLGDMNRLAEYNREAAQSELDRVQMELEQLEPQHEASKKARTEVSEELDNTLESSTTETYNYTRETIADSINKVSEQDLGIIYPGPFSCLQYAEDIKDAMISEIANTVYLCEERARNKSIQGFNAVKNLGLMHVGNKFYEGTMFNPEKMFMKRRHNLARQVDIDLEMLDFFDFSYIWEKQEKLAGTGMAGTVALVVGGRLFGGASWVDGALGAFKVLGVSGSKRLILPSLITLVGVALAFAVQQIPTSLPRRLSTKLATQLAAQDYVHDNATRISAEVRRALKNPSQDLRIELQRGVEKLEKDREDRRGVKAEAGRAKTYFAGLEKNSANVRRRVEGVDLEGAPPGLASQYAL